MGKTTTSLGSLCRGALRQILCLMFMVVAPILWWWSIVGGGGIDESKSTSASSRGIEINNPSDAHNAAAGGGGGALVVGGRRLFVSTGILLVSEAWAYVQLPLDLIPDFIPFFGKLDDGIAWLVAGFGMLLVFIGFTCF